MDLFLSLLDSSGDPSSAFVYRVGLPCRPQPLSKLARRFQATNFLTCLHHSVSVQSSPDSRHFNRESQLHPPRGTARRAFATHAALSHVLLDGFAIASSFPTVHLVRGTFSRRCLELSAASQLHQHQRYASTSGDSSPCGLITGMDCLWILKLFFHRYDARTVGVDG
jgi:hypothetical protein